MKIECLIACIGVGIVQLEEFIDILLHLSSHLRDKLLNGGELVLLHGNFSLLDALGLFALFVEQLADSLLLRANEGVELVGHAIIAHAFFEAREFGDCVLVPVILFFHLGFPFEELADFSDNLCLLLR